MQWYNRYKRLRVEPLFCDQLLMNRSTSKVTIANKISYNKNDNSLWVDVLPPTGAYLIMIDNNAPPPLSNEYIISLPPYLWMPAKITDSRLVNKVIDNNNSKLSDALLNIKGLIKVSIDITSFYAEFKNRLKCICQSYKNTNINVIDCDKYFVNDIDGNNDMPYLTIVKIEKNTQAFYDVYIHLDSANIAKYRSKEQKYI